MQSLVRGGRPARFCFFLLILLSTGSALAQSSGAPPPIPVEVATARQEPLAQELTAVGTLLADESVIIRPEIGGRISEILFEEGQRVERGALLFRLDNSIYQAELDQAQADLALSRRNADRAQELFRKGSGTARSLDEAAASLESNTARVALARARLAKTELRAPFAGVLGLRQVSVGDYVNPGQALVNLEDLDPVKVDFRVPETELARLRTGQALRIRVDAFPGRSFAGEVYALDPRIDAQARSVSLRARVGNPEAVLRPGLFARVALVVATDENAVLIPEQAVFPRGEQRLVYRVLDGKATLTPVLTGSRGNGLVQIREGLAAGDVVVTAGQIKLRDGAPVRPVNAEAGN